MAKSNIQFCEETISKKQAIEVGWLELAKCLKEIRDKGLYEGRWNNFEEFLSDPMMGMDKGTASKMINIHEKLVLEYEIDQEQIANSGGWSVIAEVLPVIKDKESAIEWLEQAQSLSKSDLRKEVKRSRNKSDDDADCKHLDTYEITLRCCRKCGDKELIKSNE